jgi:nicotinamidase/pyrazinamidase
MDNELIAAVVALDDPTPPVPFNPNAKKLFVLVDTQYDFMMSNGALYVEGAESLFPSINKKLFELTQNEPWGFIYTMDSHNKDTYPNSGESRQFPIHCVEYSAGWSNVFDGLINYIADHGEHGTLELKKGVFDMWAEEHFLRDRMIKNAEAEGIRDVVIFGVAADFCVKWAADGFLRLGWNVEIPRTLTAGIYRDIDTVVAEDYVGQNIKVIG